MGNFEAEHDVEISRISPAHILSCQVNHSSETTFQGSLCLWARCEKASCVNGLERLAHPRCERSNTDLGGYVCCIQLLKVGRKTLNLLEGRKIWDHRLVGRFARLFYTIWYLYLEGQPGS